MASTDINLPRLSRRQMLASMGGGAGLVALKAMLAEQAVAAESPKPDLHAPKEPHYTPRATRVIWLFMHGGPSHVDLFDPKPDLVKYAGPPIRLQHVARFCVKFELLIVRCGRVTCNI